MRSRTPSATRTRISSVARRMRNPRELNSSTFQNSIDTARKSVVLKGRPLPKSLRYVGKYFNVQVQTCSLGNKLVGRQVVGIIAAQNTLSQFITSSGNQPAWYQAAKSYFDDNPNAGTSGSNTYLANIAPVNQYCFVLNNNFQVMVTNFESISTMCDLYLCLSKKNQDNDPIGVWNSDLQSQGLSLANQVFDNSADKNSGVPAVGHEDAQNPGCRPGGRMFKRQWKILSVRRMKLAAGATEECSFNVRVNRAIRRDMLAQDTSPFVAGMSLVLFAVAKSQLVSVKRTYLIGATSFKPTYGEVSLGFAIRNSVTTTSYSGNAVVGSRHALAYITGENTATGPTGRADITEVNENDTLAQVVVDDLIDPN